MRVLVIPEKVYESLGAVRYQLTWEELRKSAEGKSDIDPDSDIIYRFENFKDQESAMKRAKEVAGESFYGSASVTRQIVDWFVEEDNVAEWVNTSDTEEVLG